MAISLFFEKVHCEFYRFDISPKWPHQTLHTKIGATM